MARARLWLRTHETKLKEWVRNVAPVLMESLMDRLTLGPLPCPGQA